MDGFDPGFLVTGIIGYVFKENERPSAARTLRALCSHSRGLWYDVRIR